MINGRSGNGRDRGAVRPSDLIRPQRAAMATTAWTVFVDVDDSPNNQRPRASRASLVRRRPTEWGVEKDESESNKENIGYEVRRPKRARLALAPRHDGKAAPSSPTTKSPSTQAIASPTATTPATPAAAPRSNGKRKLRTPTPPPKEKKTTVEKISPSKEKTATIKKSTTIPTGRAEVLPEPTPEPISEPVRRPLEDITHLFSDPTARCIQPWRRATRLTMRASSMRTR